MSIHIDLIDLRLMTLIAETNSLTQGAKAAHISLPAASTRVKNLEESLGAKLLYRTSQGVTLTLPGQALVHHARSMLAQLEHMRNDLQEYAKGVKGHLRMFANTTALGEYLPSVLRAYLISHPNVNIDLRERLSPDTVRAVSEGQIDIGIVAGTVRTENLEIIPYRRDYLAFVVPCGHPLDQAHPIDFAQTLAFDHIGLPEASAIHSFLSKICDDLNLRMNMRIQVGNFESVCRMIEAGVGVGILPVSAARRHAQSMRIKVIPLNDPWALRAQLICVRSLAALPAFARDLVDMLNADARDAESLENKVPAQTALGTADQARDGLA